MLVNRFSERLIASGVKVFLGTAPSVADLAELKPDTLIVATGSVPVIPRFCEGIANAVTAEDILTGKAKAGQRVLVVGGGMVGSETAEYLALKGGDVTILELRPDLAADMQARAGASSSKASGSIRSRRSHPRSWFPPGRMGASP